MKKNLINQKQNGFTVIELLIATSVASVILLLAAFTIIQISRMYYKASVLSRTQDTTRSITDIVSRQIQFANGTNVKKDTVSDIDLGSINVICVGADRFTYVINALQDDSKNNGHSLNGSELKLAHAMWHDTITNNGACVPAKLSVVDPSATTGGTNGSDMLSHNMRLSKFGIDRLGSTNVWALSVKVIYGESDLINDIADPDNARCKSGVSGSQWCAVAEYNTSIGTRM